MLRFGSIFYAMYFIVSFSEPVPLDEDPGDALAALAGGDRGELRRDREPDAGSISGRTSLDRSCRSS